MNIPRFTTHMSQRSSERAATAEPDDMAADYNSDFHISSSVMML